MPAKFVALISILCIIFTFDTGLTSADSRYLLDIDFDSMTAGQEPGEGIITYNTNAAQQSAKSSVTVAQRPGGGEGDLCLKFSDFTKSSGYISIAFPFASQKSITAVEFDVYKAAGTPSRDGVAFNLNDSNNRMGVALQFLGNRVIRYRGGMGSSVPFSEYDVKTGFQTDAWHKMKIVANYAAKTFDCYIDGVQAVANVPLRLDDVVDFSRIFITGGNYSEALEYERTMYLDNIRVYAMTPPSVEGISFTAKAGGTTGEVTDVPGSLQSIDLKIKTSPGASIAAECLSSGFIKLTAEGTEVYCDYIFESGVLRISPAADLDYEREYTVTLSGVYDTNHMALPRYESTFTTQEPPIKFTTAFYDASGGAITELSPDQKVKAVVTVKNNTGTEVSPALIFTVYNALAVDSINQSVVTVQPGQTAEPVEIEVTTPSGDCSGTVYFWDNLYDMNWLGEAVGIN